ncbi:MAG: sodium:alanine symporter family protein [Proteobacteria bacterium]|nr:sodium:alanine symporter family protein [Pseudomonadota bacterium]
MQVMFDYLAILDDLLWQYIALFIILASGALFAIKSRFFQFRVLSRFTEYIIELHKSASPDKVGTKPLRLYFASIGGMIGLGNIVVVATTVTMGGPGSLIWLWIASFLGMLIKYAEIYLGIKYRVHNRKGGYDGGPMYYLQHAFGNKFVSIIICLLLCIYGAEVSQFLVLTDTIMDTLHFERELAIMSMLVLVMLGAAGGVRYLANICAVLMPIFMMGYIGIGTLVIIDNYEKLPAVLAMIWNSAWLGHAPIGGFLGSSMLMAAHYGVSRAVYSGDIGIGYDSIIQSETQTRSPHKQARMAVYALLTDSIICTISTLIILLTGVWHQHLKPSEYVATALSEYIPNVKYFMAALFFLAGFTTIIGYLVVGQKCARYLNPKVGQLLYLCYAAAAFIFFSYHEQNNVLLLMSVSGGLLMIINLAGILRLRNEIKFM